MTAGAAVPRIAPGSRAEIGRLNFALAQAIGAAAGGGPPNVFTTLARNRHLFRAWLRFAGRLMPGGEAAGLSAAEIERVREGPGASGWQAPQALLLRAADELHERRSISDRLWDELRGRYRDAELIELFMLIGHYEMLAMTLNALAVQPDAPAGEPGRGLRVLRRLAERRGGAR